MHRKRIILGAVVGGAMKAIAFLLISAATVFAQEHAPTVEQCRADAAVWSAKDADIKTPTMRELWLRVHEMNQCLAVDPIESAHEHTLEYLTVCRNVGDEYSTRVVSFLNRHDAKWKRQFDAEDADGKR
jgi:hypothetical protein